MRPIDNKRNNFESKRLFYLKCVKGNLFISKVEVLSSIGKKIQKGKKNLIFFY